MSFRCFIWFQKSILQIYTVHYIINCITQMFLFDLYQSDTVQLITVTQKHCFHLSVSTRMILCRVVLALCCSLDSVNWVPGHGIVPVHIQNYSPVNSSMTCAIKDNSWNSKKYLITFYIISWVIIYSYFIKVKR